jgi:hypothetical protein
VTISGAISALAYAGVGAGVGSIGAAIVSTHASKGESRAHAANLISEAAAGLAERQVEIIDRITDQNERMRQAIILLSDVLDELLPQLPLSAPDMNRLKKATNAAKSAL